MPAQNLTSLAERKRILVLQADLHRAILEMEIARARSGWQWIRDLRERATGHSWWVAGGGALAGFLILRRWRKALKWIPAAMTAWRWLRKLKAG